MGKLLEGNLIDGLGLLASRVPDFIKDDLAHNSLTYLVCDGIRVVDVSNLNRYSIVYFKVKQALKPMHSVCITEDLKHLATILDDLLNSMTNKAEPTFSELVGINNVSKSLVNTYSIRNEIAEVDLSELYTLATFWEDRIELILEKLYYNSK